MSSATQRPDWALPPGVPRGVWDYSLSPTMASEYDQFHAGNYLLSIDEQFVADHAQGNDAVDLGCGSGRLTRVLLAKGLRVLGVDLSRHMLAQTRLANAHAGSQLNLVRANLVDLSGICDARFDTAICMFSTLGMIAGRIHRQRALRESARILRPGGVLLLHVHSVWGQAYTAAGRSWLASSLWKRGEELGDRTFDYRGVPKMFLHLFRPSEIRTDLAQSGFRIRRLQRLDAQRQGLLRWSWFLGDVRSDGLLIAAEKSA